MTKRIVSFFKEFEIFFEKGKLINQDFGTDSSQSWGKRIFIKKTRGKTDYVLSRISFLTKQVMDFALVFMVWIPAQNQGPSGLKDFSV
jgi:hypothetical protein